VALSQTDAEKNEFAARLRLYEQHTAYRDFSVADVLRRRGNLAGAEALFVERLALEKVLWPDDPAAWHQSVSKLADVLARQGRHSQAEQMFHEVLTPSVLGQPNCVGLLRERASYFARRGRWSEAATDLGSAVDLDPRDHWDWFRLLPLLAQEGNAAKYRQRCRQMLDRFSQMQDPNIAERTAKACLLLPDSGVALTNVCGLADTALRLGSNSGDLTWFQLCKGLAAYRQGHFADAVEWTEKVLRQPGGPPTRNLAAVAVLGMAEHKLNQTLAARTALSRAAKLESVLPKLERGDLGEDWHDWIVAHILLKEAQAIIASPTTRAPE
jgi:tetratricopeptide (TPR) repeat protein